MEPVNGDESDQEPRAGIHEAGLKRPAPLTAAVLAGAVFEGEIRRALQGLNVTLECTGLSGVLLARIESACPEIVIVDLDITPRPNELAIFARSLRPDVCIVSAQWYWSDHEPPTFADAVVHKPARRDEWFPALARIELSIANRCSFR